VKITIAIDIMGGDRGPHVFFHAIENTLKKHSNISLIICGDEHSRAAFTALLTQYHTRIIYEVCDQIVEMTDKPALAIRQKKQSSMYRALELTQQEHAQACVSAGNTGALMAMAYYVLKTIPGVSRPALCTLLPAQNKNKVLLLSLIHISEPTRPY